MSPSEIFLTIVVILLMGMGAAAVFAYFIEDDDRHIGCYCCLREKIMSPKNQKHFFKRIRWFKKLLRNKSAHEHIVDDIVWVRKVQVEAQYNQHLNIEKELAVFPWKVDVNEMWKLADQRQLFSINELKAIDKVNAAIDKKVGETVAKFE